MEDIVRKRPSLHVIFAWLSDLGIRRTGQDNIEKEECVSLFHVGPRCTVFGAVPVSICSLSVFLRKLSFSLKKRYKIHANIILLLSIGNYFSLENARDTLNINLILI